MCSVTSPLRLIESPLRHLTIVTLRETLKTKHIAHKNLQSTENNVVFQSTGACEGLLRPEQLTADAFRAFSSDFGSGRLATTQGIWGPDCADITPRPRSSGLQTTFAIWDPWR